jgi:hypothetical protein
MLRKCLLLLSTVSLAALCVSTISCGSSSNSTTACTGGPYNVVGDWNGNLVNSSGTVNVFGAIDASGLAVFFDNTTGVGVGDTLLLPAITGTCSFSGADTFFASLVDLGGSAGGTAQGNVNSATAISGTDTATGSTISLTTFSPLSGSATALSGTKTGETGGGGDFLSLTFTPTTGSNMSFTGTDITANCTLTGTLTQQGTSNVFDLSLTISGAGASCTPTITVNGIAFESNTDYFNFNGGLPGTYLYADILSSSSAAVVEVF